MIKAIPNKKGKKMRQKENHPWHSISMGNNAPKEIVAIIEVPKGSKNKYEIDKESGLLKLDRVLFSAVRYPENYGFIPQSLGEDDDPLDILVLGQEAVHPLTILQARPIGVLNMLDQEKEDSKIISVSTCDPEYSDFDSISSLPKHKLIEIKQFFKDYKQLENKKVEVMDILGVEDAHKIINAAIKSYSIKFRGVL